MTATATIGELRDRVTAGAAWLDQHIDDWPALIDLTRFDIDDRYDCVLGQVIGDFWIAPLTWAQAVAMGFQARNGDAFEDEVEALDRLWRDVIERRRAAT